MLFKLNIKLFAQDQPFAPAEFVPVFHHWIQNQSLPGYLLIDVADYSHVPAGPGSLLVSSQANIHMDRSENRLGLLYVRKLPVPGADSFQDHLHGVLAETLKIAAKLESEPELIGRLKFRTDEISIRLNDRLLAPNNAEILAKFLPDVESTARILLGSSPFTVEHYDPSPLSLFELRIKSNSTSSVTSLLERLEISVTVPPS